MARILVVEDEPDHSDVIREILRWAGHESLILGLVAGVQEALSAYAPQIVLVDLELPDGDGFQVVDAVRATSSTADVPVVAITGDPALERRARNDGRIALVCPKPCDLLLALSVILGSGLID